MYIQYIKFTMKPPFRLCNDDVTILAPVRAMFWRSPYMNSLFTCFDDWAARTLFRDLMRHVKQKWLQIMALHNSKENQAQKATRETRHRSRYSNDKAVMIICLFHSPLILVYLAQYYFICCRGKNKGKKSCPSGAAIFIATWIFHFLSWMKLCKDE